jgi:hypothetical protein
MYKCIGSEACSGYFSSEEGSIFKGGRGKNIFIKGRISLESAFLPPLKRFPWGIIDKS